jgi:hypothetical protein
MLDRHGDTSIDALEPIGPLEGQGTAAHCTLRTKQP